jgi:tRNA (guanine6-N2)-methyltransferase
MKIKDLIKQGTYHRKYRIGEIPASLNPAIGYALNKLAEVTEDDRVLDPCCGTGTILIERQLMRPGISIGVDINPKVLEIAKENTHAAGVEIEYKHGDIMEIKFPDNYFTKIISNLPFGIQTGSKEKNKELYRFLADSSINWLKPGGIAVFYTNSKSLLKNAFSFNSNWELVEEIEMKYGGLTPSIFIYRKTH